MCVCASECISSLCVRVSVSHHLSMCIHMRGSGTRVCVRVSVSHHISLCIHMDIRMGCLRVVGSLKLYVSFAEYHLFYRALLQKRPMILRSLLIVATPYDHLSMCIHMHIHTRFLYILDACIRVYASYICMYIFRYVGVISMFACMQISVYS